MNAYEKELKSIGKTPQQHTELNKKLSQYGIDIARTSKGWRAQRISKPGEPTRGDYTIAWIGIGVLKEWFDNPEMMAVRFLQTSMKDASIHKSITASVIKSGGEDQKRFDELEAYIKNEMFEKSPGWKDRIKAAKMQQAAIMKKNPAVGLQKSITAPFLRAVYKELRRMVLTKSKTITINDAQDVYDNIKSGDKVTAGGKTFVVERRNGYVISGLGERVGTSAPPRISVDTRDNPEVTIH